MADRVKIKTVEFDNILKDEGLPKQVERVVRTLKKYDCAARKKWIADRQVAWDAIENVILTEEDEKLMRKKGQEPFAINKCNKGVQGSTAIVTDQKPEIKFIPIGSGDLYVAELMKRAHDVVWEKSEGSDEVYRFVEEAKIGAMGFMNSYHNPTKGLFGKIMMEEVDPSNIYWSSKSRRRDFGDTHLIKAVKRTAQYIKDHYPDITDDDLEYDLPIDLEQQGAHDTKTGEDQYASGDGMSEMDEDDCKNVWEIEAWMLETQTLHINVYVKNGSLAIDTYESHEEAINNLPEGGQHVMKPRDVRRQLIIVGKKIIHEEINPYGEDSDGDPIMPLVGLPAQRTRSAYPKSPTMYAAPINRMKVKNRAKLEFGVAQTVNSPIVRPDNCRWTGNPGTPGSELIVPQNIPFQPYRLGAGSSNMQLFRQMEEMADRDIDDQYDLHDVMRGKMDGKMAWQTVYALQEFGGMMSKPFLRSLESALTRIGKINIALIMRHWTREMWERLIEPKEWLEWVPDDEAMQLEQIKQVRARHMGKQQDELTQQDMQDVQEQIKNRWLDALELIRPSDPLAEPGISLVDLDVKVMAGSSMPTNRMAKMNQAMEFVGAGIYDAQAALEYVDDPNKDQIIARMDRNAQAAAQAQAIK